ncbi:MAG: OB-fold domain-containing protein [Ignavibacteria bacterium]|nr:OB-fold domain-containing protein [Ignavibacteria bacterium]
MELNIYAYKCKRCGELHYPYKTICKKCGENDHNEFEIVPLPKNGKLLTFTTLYTLPSDYEVVTLALGIVELEDGNRITGQLDIKNPKIGMKVNGKVEVVRKDLYKKHLGMIFYKA